METLGGFASWAWARHHNPPSWYIRPLFVLPLCHVAYRRSWPGVLLTILAVLSRMFWFPAPATTDARAARFLAMERESVTGSWGFAQVAMTALVAAWFVALAAAWIEAGPNVDRLPRALGATDRDHGKGADRRVRMSGVRGGVGAPGLALDRLLVASSLRVRITALGQAMNPKDGSMARVTGIGGIFFKSTGDPTALAAWYQKHLGMSLEDFGGAILRWPDDTAEDKGLTVWSVAKGDTKWFSPSTASFMINYRVDDLDGMLAQLRAGGVAITQGPESHENGKFAWVMDPDGNKVELWEPMPWGDKNKGS